MNRPVTERDFRMEEFRDADPNDYEFRGDGKIVRKDRWETGIYSIRSIVGISGDFEISEVVDRVRELVKDRYDWETDTDREIVLEVLGSDKADVKLQDGSLLMGVTYNRKDETWSWRDIFCFKKSEIASYRLAVLSDDEE